MGFGKAPANKYPALETYQSVKGPPMRLAGGLWPLSVPRRRSRAVLLLDLSTDRKAPPCESRRGRYGPLARFVLFRISIPRARPGCVVPRSPGLFSRAMHLVFPPDAGRQAIVEART
jgi:hypothetical protein